LANLIQEALLFSNVLIKASSAVTDIRPEDEDIQLTIKFPSDCPFEFQTIMLPSASKVGDVIRMVQQHFKLDDQNKLIGLYINADNLWLDNDAPLSTYKGLKFLKFIEYKDKTTPSKRGSNEARPRATSDMPTKSTPETPKIHSMSASVPSSVPAGKPPQKSLPTTPTVSDKERKMKAEISKLSDQVADYQQLLEEGTSFLREVTKESETLKVQVAQMQQDMLHKDDIIKLQALEIGKLRRQLVGGGEKVEQHEKDLLQEIDEIFSTE